MSGAKAGIMVSNQQREGVNMVSALEEQIVMVRLARDRGWDSFFSGQHDLNEGGNTNALASMRLMSEELLPALHGAGPTPLEKISTA